MNLLSLVLAAALAQPQPIPTILDTDIGSDIDDAFAVALAATSPNIELRGITTSGDQPDDRAWIVCRMLTHGELKKVPVYAGKEPQPKNGIDWQIQYRRHAAPIFNRTQKPEKMSAVDFMHKEITDNPSPVTILAIGPLTNVARLLKEHPEDAKKIGRLVLMGGSIEKGFGSAKPEPEWNIKSDIPAAQAVFKAGIPMMVIPLDATAHVKFLKIDRDRLFAAYTPLTLQIQNLYELWGNENQTPTLFDPVAVAAVMGDRFLKNIKTTRLEVDDKGMTVEVKGEPNCRVALDCDAPEFVKWVGDSLTGYGKQALPQAPKNLSKLVDRGAFPAKVHVAEDYDTDIEKRWWMSGKAETKDVAPGGRRSQRGVLTQDFDDRQGDMRTSYHAVVFNPVPGPPMGKNTRLAFRYKLIGTDHLRIQLYSLTNGYHRYLSVKGLPQNEWQSGCVDMTQMRRPDGTGGPLADNERIDDIQFYVDPRHEVIIDDVILYDAAAEGEKRPFPKRVIYTAWFDTGKKGNEWRGDFDHIAHEKPRMWKAARSVARENDTPWIRLDMKGPRRLDSVAEVSFQHLLVGADTIRVELRDSKSGQTWTKELTSLAQGTWGTSTARFDIKGDASADEIRFILPTGATLTVDDVLLYTPGA